MMEKAREAEISFRTLSMDDWETIADVAASAFGPSPHRATEIRRYLALEPNYWLLATLQGDPVGVVGATDYGPFAYVGMMTVRKEHQGKGIGGALFRRELEWLAEQGVSFLRLDASEAGYPIYRRSGFEVVDRAVMFRRPDATPFPEFPENVHTVDASELGELAAFDTPVFGADRTPLLRALLGDFPGRGLVSHDRSGRITGFLFAQGVRIGPWAARAPEDAESLLQAALTLPFQGHPVAIAPGVNRAALELLGRYGFSVKLENRHMHRGGGAVPGDRAAIYGLTSFAVG